MLKIFMITNILYKIYSQWLMTFWFVNNTFR